jgi:diacylglycerol kinase family enzyme
MSSVADPAAPPSPEPAAPPDAAPDAPVLTPHTPLKSVTLLVNPVSGSTGQGAAARAEALLARYPLESRVVALTGSRFESQIEAALADGPDLLAVLAGDGTARAAAGLAGPRGPLIAPLPGGTMNMLPKALYGTADWGEALARALEEGEPQDVSGGEVDGHAFYCAAILGSPALWAPAREAVREGRFSLAWQYARRAARRAFSGRVRYRLDGRPARRAGALALISPMISRVLDEDDDGLEAAALSPADAAEVFRLAYHALIGDWRQDPSVMTGKVRRVQVDARSRIPAVLDGESVLLGARAEVRFRPRAFRALAPRPPAEADSV